MPIYEYQCTACGAVTDVKHGFKERYDQPCATCGGQVQRRFTPAGIVFKGSGFYVTDSRKPAQAVAPKDGPAEKTPAHAETKTDAGGDAKKDAAPKSEPAAPASGKKDAAA